MGEFVFRSNRRFKRTVALPPSRLHLSVPDDLSDKPRWWRETNARLAGLGYAEPHTALSDYDLVRTLSMGCRLTVCALLLDMDVPTLRKRWDALTDPMRDEDGRLSFEAQQRLLQVLRHRAGA